MSDTAWWTKNWNVVDGCSHVSPACDHCYAEMMSRRFWQYRFEQGDMHYTVWAEQRARTFADVRFHADRLEQPLHWRDPQRVFTTSMGDLFHRDVDDDALMAVFDVMRRTPKHRYLVLTKRPIRAQQFYLEHPLLSLLSNVWLGVTVEDRKRITRLNTLRRIKVAHRWASFEPLLEPLVLESMQLDSLEWAVIGGETGAKARLTKPGWLISMADQLWAHGVPVWFKQWGHALERVADPSDLEVRDLYCGIADTRELPVELDVLA
jgi:protein gp37